MLWTAAGIKKGWWCETESFSLLSGWKAERAIIDWTVIKLLHSLLPLSLCQWHKRQIAGNTRAGEWFDICSNGTVYPRALTLAQSRRTVEVWTKQKLSSKSNWVLLIQYCTAILGFKILGWPVSMQWPVPPHTNPPTHPSERFASNTINWQLVGTGVSVFDLCICWRVGRLHMTTMRVVMIHADANAQK